MPALLFPANSADAFQSFGMSSPPPTAMTIPAAYATSSQPDRDDATFALPPRSVQHYAPPVHIQPPSKPGHRVPGPPVSGRTSNGRHNATQSFTYDARPTRTKLSDESLSSTARPKPAQRGRSTVQAKQAKAAHDRSSVQQGGGLQARIASVLKRRDSTDPTDGGQLELDTRSVRVPTLAVPALDQAVVAYAGDAAEPARVAFASEAARAFDSEDAADQQEVHQVALVAPVQLRSNTRVRRPQVSQTSRPVVDRSTIRGRQISVLSSGQDEDSPSNKLRSANDFGDFGLNAEARQTPSESVEDLDPFEQEPSALRNDLGNGLDDMEQNDLDSDIEAELNRLRRDDDMDDDLEDFDDDLDDDLDDLDDLDDDDDDEADIKPPVKSCDEFRNQLLDSTIRDIPLDISPPASSLRARYGAVSRAWFDRSGMEMGHGAIVDLRRGYVILDSGQKIAYARLGEQDWAAVSEYWGLPTVCSVGNRGSVERCWIPQTFTWTATSLCHKPLYFENIQLERYGHSHGPFSQPVHSVAHFFVSLVTVSYQSAIHPANECQYALGYYRPGNCAPWLREPIPISLSGARRQALAVTGLALLP